MNRGYNFGAGPAMLPYEILREAQEELLNWRGTGMSILEMGHRTPEFIQLMEETDYLMRQLMGIPDHYHVLFFGMPARSHFGMLPINLLQYGQQAGFLVTGTWSSLAFKEAKKVRSAYCIASSESSHFTEIPDRDSWQILDKTTYLHYTPNETINGVRVAKPLSHLIKGHPVIADMTSCILSEPMNVEDYALIFAGAQKNIANAGLSVMIVRDDLIQTIQNDRLPTMFDYRTFVQSKSLYATLPVFNCYLALKMLKWVKQQGGVEALYQINCKKAALLYEYLDSSPFYDTRVATDARSIMNVCFYLKRPEFEARFIAETVKAGLLALKGHRDVGGLRASLYNAMPLAGVEALINFMDEFAKEHFG